MTGPTSGRVAAAADDHTGWVRAASGVVRLLCDVRLGALAVAVVVLVLRADDGDTYSALLILLALPFSFVPLRTWDRSGEALVGSRILLGADTAMSAIVVAVLGGPARLGEFGAVYAGATLALLGVMIGWRWSVPAALGLAAVQTGVVVLLHRPSGWQVIGPVAALLGLSWVGDRLGRLLRDQATMAHQLVEARSRAAATQERALLAREMHDSLAKTVDGIGLLAAAHADQLRRVGSPLEPDARLIQVSCQTAHDDARTLLGGLRASSATALGEAVEAAVRRWQVSAAEVRVDLACAPGTGVVGADVAWAVVRILQEALDNVGRHSSATAVSVRLEVVDAVRLTVTDDGTGLGVGGGADLDLDRLRAAGHYGLVGMAERAMALGGEVRFLPGEGRGTRVEAAVPRESSRPSRMDEVHA